MATAPQRGKLAVVVTVALVVFALAVSIAVGAVTIFEDAVISPGDRASAMAWLARLLLVLAVCWVAIGAISARTSLVRRPGAAAARVSWLAATRPWRARESTLGMLRLDRWLLLLVPGALLAATRAVQTASLAPMQLALIVGTWLIFVGVVMLLNRRRSPWPVIAAVGGVLVLRCILTLLALSAADVDGSQPAVLTEDATRAAYVALSTGLFVWLFVGAAWALSTQVGVRRAVGAVLAGAGVALAVPATVVALIGFERVLTAWTGELGVFPWGLARLLGVTLSRDVPGASAWYAVGVGLTLALVGAVLARASRSGGRV